MFVSGCSSLTKLQRFEVQTGSAVNSSVVKKCTTLDGEKTILNDYEFTFWPRQTFRLIGPPLIPFIPIWISSDYETVVIKSSGSRMPDEKKLFLKVDEEETWIPAKSDGWRNFSFSLPQKGIPRRLTLEIRDSTKSIQIAFIKSGDWDYNPFFVPIGDKFHNYEACLNKD